MDLSLIKDHEHLTDASWNDKFAASILIVGILIIGIAPFWLFELLNPGTDILMKNIERIVLNP
jgi:NADH-quinone oxidoreductase subunit M